MNEKREKLIEEIGEKAVQNEINYGGCSQSVLASLQENLNIGNESTFMAGTALAGGVARGNETCGALAGALMVISIVAGRKRIADVDTLQSCMKLAIEAREIFRERVGHSICAEIQKSLMGKSYKLSDAEERAQFHHDGGRTRDKCPSVCGKAAVIAAEILFREKLI